MSLAAMEGRGGSPPSPVSTNMPPKDPSQLLADSKWMRALAGSLIYGDGSVLDDLVQETWVVALQNG
jgi:hypothetical protein